MKTRSMIDKIKRHARLGSHRGVSETATYGGYRMILDDAENVFGVEVSNDLISYRRFVESNFITSEISDGVKQFVGIEDEADAIWIPGGMTFPCEMRGLRAIEQAMETKRETKNANFTGSSCGCPGKNYTIDVAVEFHNSIRVAWVTIDVQNDRLVRSRDGLLILAPPK